MRDIAFQRSIYHALADFAHRRMTHRSLGVGGYGFGGPRACPWGSMEGRGYPIFPYLNAMQFGGKYPWWERDLIDLECPDRYNVVSLRVERKK